MFISLVLGEHLRLCLQVVLYLKVQCLSRLTRSNRSQVSKGNREVLRAIRRFSGQRTEVLSGGLVTCFGGTSTKSNQMATLRCSENLAISLRTLRSVTTCEVGLRE